MTFYLSLFIFIISFVIGLGLMIGGKGMKRDRFLLLTSVHFIFLLAFLASLLLQKNDGKIVFNYFFMVFICSGLILSGLAWRSKAHFILRIYFSFFILTIPLFMFSPSMLLNFLLTMKFSSTYGASYPLGEKYFLEMQNSSSSDEDIPHYKVILKKGIFHQTIQRDITFNGKLDSVRVVEKDAGKSILLRGFTSKETYVSSHIDSMDVPVLLKKIRQGDVEYHL